MAVKAEIKKLETKEKITKGAELKQLQDNERTLRKQENMCYKEEWTQFHHKFNDQWKGEEDKTEENMSNRCDPKEEEAMGENHHHAR